MVGLHVYIPICLLHSVFNHGSVVQDTEPLYLSGSNYIGWINRNYNCRHKFFHMSDVTVRTSTLVPEKESRQGTSWPWSCEMQSSGLGFFVSWWGQRLDWMIWRSSQAEDVKNTMFSRWGNQPVLHHHQCTTVSLSNFSVAALFNAQTQKKRYMKALAIHLMWWC